MNTECHGQDIEAAKRRALRINGVVVESQPEGYYSEEAGNMLRSWERIIADYTNPA